MTMNNDVNFVLDVSEVKENYIGIRDKKVFQKIFYDSNIINEVLFEKENKVENMNIQKKLEMYAEKISGFKLKEFLKKYLFQIDKVITFDNPFIGKTTDINISLKRKGE